VEYGNCLRNWMVSGCVWDMFHVHVSMLDICQKGIYYLGIEYLIIYLSTLKNFPIIQGYLNMLYNISYTTPFIH